MPRDDQQVITAKITKICFRKPDSLWTIAKTDQGTVKGVIGFEPNEGDCIRMEGRWEKSTYTGEQEFSFRTAILDVPDDPHALLEYAVSITKGLGLSRKELIWDKYGEDWREHDTLDIPGVGESTQFHWQDTLRRLNEQADQTQAIAFLISKGSTLNMATVAWQKWKKDTLGKIKADPFTLAELPNYGFTHVDNGIRQRFDIGDDDPRRLDAAVLYVMVRAMESGGTLALWSEIFDATMDIVAMPGSFDESIQRLVDGDKIVIMEGQTLALIKDHTDEAAIWERFKA